MNDNAHRLARAALRHWGITDCQPQLLKQRENYVFAVRTAQGAPAVLRMHRPHYHSDAAIRSELQWLANLHGSGLPVPQPIADLQGRLLVQQTSEQLPEPRTLDMLSWVAGKPLGEWASPLPWTPAELERVFHALGAAMARLHNVSDSWRPPRGFTRHA